MSEATERLLVRIDATTEVLRRELKKADDAVKNSQSVIERGLSRIDKAFKNTQFNVSGKLAGIFSVAGASLFTKNIIEASNSMAKLRGQLGLVTDSQEELNATYDKALRLANETGQSTESTVNLYARLARSTEELNLSQEDLFTVTKAINQSFVVSGASAQEAGAAILQLSQGMASGVLRGEELNSVMENSPRLARAIAEGLGVTIGQLRAMGKEGELTAEAVTSALMKTAGTINSEFQTMPVTISRVWQTMSNDIGDALGSVDAAPLIASIEELRAVISDPAFKESVVELSNAMLSIVTSSASALAGMVSLSRFVGEEMAASFGGIATDDIPRLEGALSNLKEELAFYEKNGHGASTGTQELREQIAKLESQLKTAYAFQENLSVATKDGADASKDAAKSVGETLGVTKKAVTANKEYAKVLKDLDKALKDINTRHEKANKAITDGIDELDEIVKSTERYIEDLEFEVSLLGQTERAQALLTVEREHGARATEEQRARMVELTATLYDAEAATKAAAEAQKPFQEALQGTAERIDSAFADAWKGAFDSFSDFADGLKNSFRQLLGELAHLAITRPIVMGFTSAIGAGGSAAASAAGGASSAGSMLSGLSSFGSSLTGAGAGFYNTVGDAATYLGADGIAIDAYQAGMTTSLSGMAYSMGAGIIGGLAGNAAFGQTSGLGSMAGGAIGSIWGPVGAGVGSFLGAGAEKLIGNVFGFGGKGGNQAGRADLNLATGSLSAYGVGNSFDQQNVDAAQQLALTIQAFSDAIGGSDASLNFKVGNRSGMAFNGRNFGGDSDAIIAAAMKEVVNGATKLSAALKSLVGGFEGSAQEVMDFARSMVNVDQLIRSNPVDVAVQQFADAQELSGYRLVDVYEKQLSSLQDLIYGFDGSLEGANALNVALSDNKKLAYDMALALQEIGRTTKIAVSDQIGYFEDSVRTPDEKLKYMEDQLKFLDAILPKLTDPNQIMQARDKALEVNKALFDAGPDDLKRANVDSFIDFANHFGDLTAQALANATGNIQVSQEDLNTQIAGMLEVSAQGFQDSANTMQSAAQLMFTAVQEFIAGNQYSQVTA